jgi:ABC-type ATPase involved in cell division
MNSRLRVERENNGQRLNRIYLKVIENKNLNFLRKDIGVVSQKSNS